MSQARSSHPHGGGTPSDWIPILIPAWTSVSASFLAWSRHWGRIRIVHRSRASAGARRSNARVTLWVQRDAIVCITSAGSIITPRFLPLHFKRSKLRGTTVLHRSTATHGRRTFSSRQVVDITLGQTINHDAVLRQVLVVCSAIHIGVLRDALLARFPTDQGPSHGASNDAGRDNQKCGSQHDPASPLHMRDEKENVDKKGQQRHQQGGKSQDEEGK